MKDTMTYALESDDEVQRLERQQAIEGYDLDWEWADWVRDGHILDAGCGAGAVSRYLAARRPGARFTGIDQSELRISQAVALNDCPRVQFQSHDITALGFADDVFDGVVSRYVFHHLPDPARGMREIVRVLRPGAPLRISDLDGIFLNLHTSDERFNAQIKRLASALPGDFYIGHKLPALCHSVGLEDVTWRTQAVTFAGAARLEERENVAQRLRQGQKLLIATFGAAGAASFSDDYMNHFMRPESTYYHLRFVVDARKAYRG